MSSIFGYVNKAYNQNHLENCFNALLRWNCAYGEKDYETKPFYGAGFVVASCIETISELLPMGKAYYEIDKRVYFVDALIYNREELGAKDNTISDEELLVQYIDKNGLFSLKNVNGDFAGVILDKKNNTLTLFRDHMGVRPLFLYNKDNILAFSSDIRGIMALSDTDITLSDEYVYTEGLGYMYGGIDKTEYQYIRCVKPASFVEINLDTLEEKETVYFKLAQHKIRYKSDDEYITELRRLIEDAVRIRLAKTDRIVGAELSGGLDSGVIDILINRFGRDCVYHSWSYDPSDIAYVENDERLVVKDICDQENISCHYTDLNKDVLPKPVDELFPLYINTTTLTTTSRYMKKNGVKLVFTGHGGDEGVSHRSSSYEMFNFGEYGHFFGYHWDSTKGEKLRFIHTIWRMYKDITYAREMRKGTGNSFALSNKIFTKEFSEKCKDIKLERHTFGYDPINYVYQGGSRNRLDNLSLQGAYAGVRYVIPYLDYRVIDFALSIPRYMHLRYGENRYIFREAFKDIMPDSMYTLTTKQDFSRASEELADKRSKEEIVKGNVADKKDACERLNPKWKSVLNYEYLEEWAKKEDVEFSGDDFGALILLSELYLADCLAEKLKK